MGWLTKHSKSCCCFHGDSATCDHFPCVHDVWVRCERHRIKYLKMATPSGTCPWCMDEERRELLRRSLC